jgi:hypothetical protein
MASLTGCCDDCPTCPQPEPEPEYRLFLSYAQHGYDYFTYTLNSRTNEFTDSVYWVYAPPLEELVFSPDGQYVAFLDANTRTLVLCSQDFRDTVAITTDACGFGLCWSPHSDLISFSRCNIGLEVLSVPSLVRVFGDTLDGGVTRFSTSGRFLFTNGESYLVIHDLESGEPAHLRSIHDTDGSRRSVFDVAATEHDSLVLLSTGGRLGPFYLHIFDLAQDSVVYEQRLPFPISFMIQRPGTEDVYFGYYGIYDIFDQGTMLKVNLESWETSTVLTTADFFYWYDYMPTNLVFLPDNQGAYIVNGGVWGYKPDGPIMVTRSDPTEVINLIEFPGKSIFQFLLMPDKQR